PDYENYEIDHAYSIFHKENDMRVMILSIGRSRLHSFPSFRVDDEGQFRQNGSLVYEYYLQNYCARNVTYMKGLISECMGVPYNNTPEITSFHFARLNPPYTTCEGYLTIRLNLTIFVISLLLLLLCFK
ncbi:hypothetical protein KR067_004358, partial [Drosophila pandora]